MLKWFLSVASNYCLLLFWITTLLSSFFRSFTEGGVSTDTDLKITRRIVKASIICHFENSAKITYSMYTWIARFYSQIQNMNVNIFMHFLWPSGNSFHVENFVFDRLVSIMEKLHLLHRQLFAKLTRIMALLQT